MQSNRDGDQDACNEDDRRHDARRVESESDNARTFAGSIQIPPRRVTRSDIPKIDAIT